MTNLFYKQEVLHSPYFICLKCAGEYSDADLLSKFSLQNYQRKPSRPKLGAYAMVCENRKWTVLADDWYYTLWHMKSTRPALREMAQFHDAFAFSIGDCDQSFDFVYYRNGNLRRHYEVVDPDFKGGSVKSNFGEPLETEAVAFTHDDDLKRLVFIAE